MLIPEQGKNRDQSTNSTSLARVGLEADLLGSFAAAQRPMRFGFRAFAFAPVGVVNDK